MAPSKNSMRRFGELASAHGTLNWIHGVFGSQNFDFSEDHISSLSGERRRLVAAYHAGIDLSDAEQAARLVEVYVTALEEWREQFGSFGEEMPADIRAFINGLQRDGVAIDDTGRPVASPTSMLAIDAVAGLDDPDAVYEQLRRISNHVDQDPAATIGAAKELIEVVCRMVLSDAGITVDKKADLAKLYKATAEELDLTRDSVPGDTASSKAAQNALQAMKNIVDSLAQMRNAMGTGHGKVHPSPALARHARLSAHAALGLGGFLIETWQQRRAQRP